MVHVSDGSALDSFKHVKADGFDVGRLLTVKIRPDRGPIFLFQMRTIMLLLRANREQQALLDHLGVCLLHTESLGYVHLAGGDCNTFLFLNAGKGYSNSRETKEADLRFQKFTLDTQRSVAWWTGHIKGGMFTRRSLHFAQAALNEILVHAGNNQLPQDLEERSAQGFEFHIHTAHHGDSHLDNGTLIADLLVTLLLRPMRPHLSSGDVVDRKKWDSIKESWRAHVKRAGNRTRSCADRMDELTGWVKETTSLLPKETTNLLPRKVTKTGPSKRKPAQSFKIQRACDRQIRLLQREAMIAKDLVTGVFIVTHSMQQIYNLAHIDGVAPIKLIPSSPTVSDLKDWRMALQQSIKERCQVLREAHRLQCTELLQKPTKKMAKIEFLMK